MMLHGTTLDFRRACPYVPSMAPQTYYRRWEVWLCGNQLGEVLAATEQAACLRAIHKFKVGDEDRSKLRVCRAKE